MGVRFLMRPQQPSPNPKTCNDHPSQPSLTRERARKQPKRAPSTNSNLATWSTVGGIALSSAKLLARSCKAISVFFDKQRVLNYALPENTDRGILMIIKIPWSILWVVAQKP